MSVANALAVLMVVVGVVVGVLAVVRPPRLRRKVVIALVAYVLLAIAVGLYAAFATVAMPHTVSRATMLARGISEMMNCGAYGVAAGLVAATLVAGSRLLFRR